MPKKFVRKKPKGLLGHDILVDVSGRMEKHDSKDVVLASSNETEAAVFVPGKVKLAVRQEIERRRIPRKRSGVLVLVIGLYLLLENSLDSDIHIVIDDELPGWSNEIKRLLLNLICQKQPSFDKLQLNVRQIGEGTRADELAWLVRNKKQQLLIF